MFDSTFQILAENSVAIPAFLTLIGGVAIGVKRFWSKVVAVAWKIAAIGLASMFAVLFLYEFTDSPFWEQKADQLIAFETGIVQLFIHFVDSVFAATLRVYLVVLSGIVALLKDLISSATPVVTANEFLSMVFLFNFFGGAVLIAGLYAASRKNGVNAALQGFGVLMLIAGVFSTLIWLDAWNFTEQVLAFGLLVTAIGSGAGVTAVILTVHPDFSTGERLSSLRDADLWGEDSEEGESALKEQLLGIMKRNR